MRNKVSLIFFLSSHSHRGDKYASTKNGSGSARVVPSRIVGEIHAENKMSHANFALPDLGRRDTRRIDDPVLRYEEGGDRRPIGTSTSGGGSGPSDDGVARVR